MNILNHTWHQLSDEDDSKPKDAGDIWKNETVASSRDGDNSSTLYWKSIWEEETSYNTNAHWLVDLGEDQYHLP